MNQKTAFEFSCVKCSSKFTKKQDRPYLYCSRSCYHSSMPGRPRPKAVMLDRRCNWCGEGFQSKSSAGARISFCSRSCQAYATAKKSRCLPLIPTHAAYIAGIVDGEGTIYIHDRRATRPESIRPSVSVVIANTYVPLLKWVSEITGVGNMGKANPKSLLPGFKPCYNWRTTSSAAVSLLIQIEPFMLEKRQRALDAIESQPLALSGG